MKSRANVTRVVACATLLLLAGTAISAQQPRPYSVEQILGYPSPENLVASPAGSTIAWTFNERGARNVYVADGPNFEARKITNYSVDDGQELTQLSFSNDGRTLVYVRGGDHGGRGAEAPPNPAGDPVQPKILIWSVPAAGGSPPKLVAEGDTPAISPDGSRVAYIRNKQVWIAPIDGSRAAQQAFYARGTSDAPVWSPNGRYLAFVSDRTDHSFIGVHTFGQSGQPAPPIRFLAPSTSRDSMPMWSPDGRRVAFLRQPGIGGTPRSPIARVDPPAWSVLVADVTALATAPEIPASTLLTSGNPPDPIVQNPGGISMRWAGNDRFVFLSYRDGFPRVYAIETARPNARPRLLTPGSFMVEQLTLTPDSRFVVYTANTGANRDDIDRRHLFRVPVDGSSDGVEAYGQLFRPTGGAARKPAVVYVHGGGPRQMMLGFHNRWEYALDYAANQYLVSRGFIVLSVDYRLSVGYGQAFQFPDNAGPRGASEYRDILAAGLYLQSRPDVDRNRIGIWGASLGGYLTALALGRNSEVFAAGVDVHGAHDRVAAITTTQMAHALAGDGVTDADLRQALKVQFESSPIAAVPTWKSPVLMIHGDDDRIVEFKQTIDLKRRLEDKGVHVEELVLPDDVHDSLLWRNWVSSISAMSKFFEKTLRVN
jgi:dipeptidyl aminopeptidase/acylaminoacyl peptidase